MLVSESWLRLVQRWLGHDYFVFVFVAAFFGAALALFSAGLAAGLLLSLSGTYEADQLLHNFYSYLVLLLFPEAFLTGALLSIFVVYRPTWVASFVEPGQPQHPPE